MRLRLVLRGLLRAPAFTLASIGTIALAVCLSTTVFAVVDGVLFKPLPYPKPEQLYVMGGLPARGSYGGFSGADIAHLQRANPDVAMALHGGKWVLKHPSRLDVEVTAQRVSARFFDVLGVKPIAGGFTREDFTRPPGSTDPMPAIVSHAFWHRHAGGSSAALGTTVDLSGTLIRIAGVLPRDFVFPDFAAADLDLLLPMPDAWNVPGDRWARGPVVVIRLEDTERLAEVIQRFDAALASTVREYGPPEDPGEQPYDRVVLVPLNASLGVNERPFFRLAFAGAALLVLIACVNVTSLVLARTRDRARELRVRVALGASRGEIARVIIAEVVLVTLAGAALGIWLGRPALALVVDQLPARLMTLKEPVIDLRVAALAVLAPLAAMLALSLMPAARAFRDAPLGATSHGTTPRARSLASSATLVLESAVGIALLVVGTFVLTSFATLRSEPIGLRHETLGVVDIIALEGGDTPATRAALQDRIRARIAAVPGVQGSAIFGGPLLERRYSALDIETGDPDVYVSEIPVSGAFFEIAGLSLVEGRLPEARDIDRGDRVIVLSRPAARALFRDASALGRQVKAYADTFTVVGVVEDVRAGSQYEGTWGEGFTPVVRSERYYASYLFKASGDVEDAAARIAAAIRLDIPGVLVERALPLDDAIAGTVRLQRFQASLFGIAGGAALLLICVGVAGIVAGSVRRRWREAGIRSALGASGGRIVRMLITDHLRPAAAGIALGLLGSWWIKEIMRRFLYQLEPDDLRIWGAATALILIVVTLAAWLPARRAAHADPATVLRAD